jgi:hypothetical protein
MGASRPSECYHVYTNMNVGTWCMHEFATAAHTEFCKDVTGTQHGKTRVAKNNTYRKGRTAVRFESCGSARAGLEEVMCVWEQGGV